MGQEIINNYEQASSIRTKINSNFTEIYGRLNDTKWSSRFTARDNQPPVTVFATLDTRNSIMVLDFDDGAGVSIPSNDESAVFVGVLGDYADTSQGLRVRLFWTSTNTSPTGNVRWAVSFEKTTPTQDIDGDSFTTPLEVTSAVSTPSGVISIATINFASNQISSLVAGDMFRLKVTRKASDITNDTLSLDAELVSVEVQQIA